MNKRTLTITLFGLFIFFGFFCLVGCGENSGTKISDYPSGEGYKIILGSNSSKVVSGGSLIILARVLDPFDNPVPDEEDAIAFSASAANATFEKNGYNSSMGDITEGTSQMIFSWEDPSYSDSPASSQICNITASYRGAVASLQIVLIAKYF